MANTVKPIQFTQFTSKDFQDESLGYFNNVMQQMANAINAANGATGKTVLPSGIDVQGSTVSGIGEPKTPTDAVSKLHAEANYSASALAPKLEAGGSHSLKTMRRLNDTNQSEQNSTFLKQLANTTPTANSTIVTGSTSGGSSTITVPAGFHQYPDGTVRPFATATFTIPNPVAQTITGLTRSGGVTTATGSFSGLTPGEGIFISGASDPSFDGSFVLVTASGSTLTWEQSGLPNVTIPVTGGSISTSGTVYFYLQYPSQTLAVDAGPGGIGYASDTQQNRLNSNRDQRILIAVAVVNSAGLVTEQSAAGATPPEVNQGNRIISRL